MSEKVDVEAIQRKLACDPPFSDEHLVGYFRVVVPALLARIAELEGALKQFFADYDRATEWEDVANAVGDLQKVVQPRGAVDH